METITKVENTALDSVLNESGLVLTEAEEIKQSYLPFFEQMAEIKELAKKINFENPTELDEKIARELRLRTQKIRTGSEQVKDSRKKIHMLKANVEQGAWNLIKATCQLDEETFAQVEKARERKEAARKAALKIEREGLIAEYCDDATLFNLGEISEEQFNSLFNGLKLAHTAKLEALLNAEKEKAEKEAKKKKHIDREFSVRDFGRFFDWDSSHEDTSDEDFSKLIQNATKAKEARELEIENQKAEIEKLKKAEEERLQLIAEEKKQKDARFLIRESQMKKLGFERTGVDFNLPGIWSSYWEQVYNFDDEKWNGYLVDIKDAIYRFKTTEKAMKEQEAKARKEKAIADAKLKEEREAKEKLESELKAKKEAEELAEKERLAELAKQEEIKVQAELMPDKEKLLDFANEVLPFLKLPEVKSAKAKKITANTRALLEKIQVYIQTETEKLK